jgi:hypothetical protein
LEDCGQETAFFSAQRPAEVEDVVSRRVWFNPPWALVGEALEKVARAWREDPRGTYAVGVVPVWRHKWWWTRFVERRKAPFRVLRVYPEGTDALFLCTGSRVFRAEGKEAPAAGETLFELAVVAIGGHAARGGGDEEGPSGRSAGNGRAARGRPSAGGDGAAAWGGAGAGGRGRRGKYRGGEGAGVGGGDSTDACDDPILHPRQA